MNKRTASRAGRWRQLRRQRRRLQVSTVWFDFSWFQYHLSAFVFFISKDAVSKRSLVQWKSMADDERWIDIAPTNPFQQRPHVFVHVRLAHPQRQTFRER